MKQMILATQIQDTKTLRVLHTIRTTTNPMDDNEILKKMTQEIHTSSAIPEDALSPSRRNLEWHQQGIDSWGNNGASDDSSQTRKRYH